MTTFAHALTAALPKELHGPFKKRLRALIKSGLSTKDATIQTNHEFVQHLDAYGKSTKGRVEYRANPSGAIVGVGELVAIDAITRTGKELRVEPKPGQQLWLAWMGDAETGNLIVVRAGKSTNAGTDAARAMHHTFHGTDPVDWNRVQWIAPRQPIEHLGHAQAVTYRIPGRMPSNKQDDDWIHRFGDFGREHGGDHHRQAQYWPGLATGHDGSIYFLRTRSTQYALKDWLIG